MQYTKGEKIAGLDGLRLRDYFKRYGNRRVTCATIMHAFSVKKMRAETILADLLRLEMIDAYEDGLDGGKNYKTTIKGNAWGMVKAIKPISRASAGRILVEFMDRVRTVNARIELAYGVESVIVFGSYVSDKGQLNDLDLSVELKGKWPDHGSCESFRKSSMNRARERDRNFSDMLQELDWPRAEVILILKNRCRTITLCEWSSLAGMDGIRYSVLHGDKERIANSLKLGRHVEVPIP